MEIRLSGITKRLTWGISKEMFFCWNVCGNSGDTWADLKNAEDRMNFCGFGSFCFFEKIM